jgi:uncharacterized membrane protein HdeD (DUF308 family)
MKKSILKYILLGLYFILHYAVSFKFKFYITVFFIIILGSFTVIELINSKKEDSENGTNNFSKSIISMLLIFTTLITYYLLT